MSLENEKRYLLLLSSYQLAKTGRYPSKAKVLDNIDDNDWIILSETDRQKKQNRNELVWRNELAFVRKHLALNGWYNSSEKNNWGITTEGEKYLKDLHKIIISNLSELSKVSLKAVDYAISVLGDAYSQHEDYMKIAVIYDSRTGNTKQAAEWIIEGMKEVPNVNAKAFSINTVDEDFVKESKGVVIGSPSYCTLMTPDIHTWLLKSAMHLELEGKLGGAFATVQYTHGGGELVVQSILINEMEYGMLCYSGGSGCGEPFIHIGPVGVNSNVESHNSLEYYRNYFVIYGNRFARKAAELFDK